jgi:putative endonuclease
VPVARDRLVATPEAFVYVLRCADGSLYCGWSTDVARRFAHHQAGRAARYTRTRRPLELVSWWPAADRADALRQEAAFKALTRTRKLALIAGDGPPVRPS